MTEKIEPMPDRIARLDGHAEKFRERGLHYLASGMERMARKARQDWLAFQQEMLANETDPVRGEQRIAEIAQLQKELKRS